MTAWLVAAYVLGGYAVVAAGAYKAARGWFADSHPQKDEWRRVAEGAGMEPREFALRVAAVWPLACVTAIRRR